MTRDELLREVSRSLRETHPERAEEIERELEKQMLPRGWHWQIGQWEPNHERQLVRLVNESTVSMHGSSRTIRVPALAAHHSSSSSGA